VAQQTDRAPLNWAVIVDLRSSAEDIAFLNCPQTPQTSIISLSHRRLPHNSVVLSWLLQNGANVVVLVDYALSFMYHIRGLSPCILRGCRKHDRQRNVVMQVNEYKLHWVACSFNLSIFHSYALCIIPLSNAGLLSKCLKTVRFQSRPVSQES
jgi:hypothetical protein